MQEDFVALAMMGHGEDAGPIADFRPTTPRGPYDPAATGRRSRSPAPASRVTERGEAAATAEGESRQRGRVTVIPTQMDRGQSTFEGIGIAVEGGVVSPGVV